MDVPALSPTQRETLASLEPGKWYSHGMRFRTSMVMRALHEKGTVEKTQRTHPKNGRAQNFYRLTLLGVRALAS